jgi:AraC-like DNA-binding protein
MKNDNKIRYNFIKSFLCNKLNLWVIVSSVILIAGLLLWGGRTKKLQIFPNNTTFAISAYDDKPINGNSQIINYKKDSIIQLDFRLREGFLNPYVGINIVGLDTKYINLTPYNQIQFEINALELKNMVVSVVTSNCDSSLLVPDDNIIWNYNIEVGADKSNFSLDLKDFRIPGWWFEKNRISPNKSITFDLEHVKYINFSTGPTVVNDSNRTIQLFSIALKKNNKRLLLQLIIAECVIFLLLIVRHAIRRKKNSIQEPERLVITYKPVNVEVAPGREINVTEYINQNFQDSDLTLEKVSNATGFKQRQIADTIQQNFDCNFKTYINRIRISESKRLLTETDLNIGEIAFKVGFNNQSHFNRVFKAVINLSPSEYRESYK